MGFLMVPEHRQDSADAWFVCSVLLLALPGNHCLTLAMASSPWGDHAIPAGGPADSQEDSVGRREEGIVEGPDKDDLGLAVKVSTSTPSSG